LQEVPKQQGTIHAMKRSIFSRSSLALGAVGTNSILHALHFLEVHVFEVVPAMQTSPVHQKKIKYPF